MNKLHVGSTVKILDMTSEVSEEVAAKFSCNDVVCLHALVDTQPLKAEEAAEIADELAGTTAATELDPSDPNA